MYEQNTYQYDIIIANSWDSAGDKSNKKASENIYFNQK